MTKGGRPVEGQWLQNEFDRLKLTGAIVGKRLGCDPTKFYNHLKGTTSLNADMLAALWVEYPEIDMYYTLTGLRRNETEEIAEKTQEAVEAVNRLLKRLDQKSSG